MHEPGEVLVSGFELTVFAKPFDVEYPTSLTAAPDGTLYISSDPNSSLGLGLPGKVVACRDTDQDGRADQFWDFIPDVDGPRGGDFVGDRFYLVHPPYLSVFWDEDGDGVAEKSKRLVDGLGASMQAERGGDHTTNGVRMGIDGWLYISVGDFGLSSATGTDGRVISLHGGGVARVRPDGSGLEVYSYHTRNHCDVAISPYLDLFSRDNTNDGKGWNIRVHHYTNLSEHGYPRLYKNFADEAVKPLLDLAGGSGTGALYLHEPGFPNGFDDRLLTCDWTTGKIYSHSLKPFEATFQAGEKEFMNLTRAIDIDVDGESRLYTADWRGGAYSFGGEGVAVGLIHRVTPKDYLAEKWPDFSAMDSIALVRQLYHRSAKRRLEAQRAILAEGSYEIHGTEIMGALNGEGPRYGHVAAIFTLKLLGGEQADLNLISLLERDDLREFVIRALGDDRSPSSPLNDKQLARFLTDQDARVRLQAAVAVGRLQRTALSDELIAAASSSFTEDHALTNQDDYRFPHTVVQVLAELDASAACLDGIADPTTRGVALAALKLMPKQEVILRLEALLEESEGDPGFELALMEVIARLVHREKPWDEKSWWQTRPDDRGPYFEPERWEASEEALTVLELAFAKLPAAHQEAALRLFGKNRLDITKMNLGEQDPVVMSLAMAQPSDAQLSLLVGAALDSERDWEQRLLCYRALTRSSSSLVLASQVEVLAGWDGEKEIQEESAREVSEFVNTTSLVSELGALAKIANEASPMQSKIAWKTIFSLSRNPLLSERSRKRIEEVAMVESKAIGYFQALEELKFLGFERAIESAINSDNRLLIETAQAAKAAIAEAHEKPAEDSGALVASLDPAEVTKQVMVAKGDAATVALGKKLYLQQACASCHAIDSNEVQKGPYLGSAGSKFKRDYLIESILDPGATVAQGFVTVLITMNDGNAHMGFVTREEDGEIDLRNIGGVVTTLKSAEIAKKEPQTLSMMPPGLASGLTVTEFGALIDYLTSLRE